MITLIAVLSTAKWKYLRPGVRLPTVNEVAVTLTLIIYDPLPIEINPFFRPPLNSTCQFQIIVHHKLRLRAAFIAPATPCLS